MKMLGKQSPKNDSRTLKLDKYINPNILPSRPKSVYYSQDIVDWGMMGNDEIGDCTTAASAHGVMSWTDDNKRLYTPTTGDAVAAYSAITGYNPSRPSYDPGAYCLDVLNYWRKTGIAGHKINSYVQINHKSSKEIEWSIDLFGLVYIGINMPLSAMYQENRWAVGHNLIGQNAPGSWGGHCVLATGFDPDGFDIITWGQRIRMTWNFWYCYVDEAYAILSDDFISNGQAPNGFDIAALQNDLQLIIA